MELESGDVAALVRHFPKLAAKLAEAQAAADGQQTAPGPGRTPVLRKKCWFAPSLQEQDFRWQALADRVLLQAKAAQVDKEEVEEIWRECANLKARGFGLPGKVILYQVACMGLLTAMAFLLYVVLPYFENPAWLTAFVHADIVHRYLAVAYFGAMGASVASLWEVVGHALGRNLTVDAIGLHIAKPAIGAFFGVMTIQLLSLSYLKVQGADAGAAATALGVASLAGMNEQLFIQKVKDLATTLFGGVNPNRKSAGAGTVASGE